MARFGRIIIVAALVLAAGWDVWPRLWAESGVHKHYLHQAQAFLHGRLDIDESFGDVATYHGKHYVVFPPLPALLITPLVAIFGDRTRTTVVSLALSVLNLVVLRGVLRRLSVERELAHWLLAGFFLGTAYTTSLFQAYETWHFAHVVAVACLLLAVYEVLGHGRAWRAGLCCGLAFLSRHLCLYAAVFLVAALWRGSGPKRMGARLLRGLGFACPVACCIGAYLFLNWLRFDDPFETGYAYIHLEGVLKARADEYGLFHPAYVPFNLVYLLLQGPHFVFAPPTYLRLEGADPFGTAILFASPFVLLTAWARGNRALLWSAWVAVALPIVHTAFYYNNGFAQTNAQRFTLDFWPILIVLVALGARRVPAPWSQAAIGYAVGLNALVLFGSSLLKRLTASL